MSEPTKFLLGEGDVPTHWVNLLPDLPGEPLPPLNPGTGQPAGPDDLTPIFPMGLILQEVSPEPEVEIPEEVREAYGLWRPTPLYRARRLETALDTPRAHLLQVRGRLARPARTSPTPRSRRRTRTRRRASRSSRPRPAPGQWGSSLAFACSLFGLECEVFMVGSSYDQKPYRRSMMETWGATVHRSPSRPHAVRPRAGRAPDRLARHRDLRGRRGRRPGPGLQLLARLGAQPRAAAPDRDRAGGDPADGAGGRRARRDRRLRRRRLELRRARVPVPARAATSARASSPPSRPRARRSPAASTATTSATRSG